MKKLLISLLFFPAISFAGTITTYFSPAGTISFSSATASSALSWAFVQGSSSTVADGGCGMSSSTMTITSQDMLVLGCSNRQSTIGGTVTDTLGNSFTLIASTSNATDSVSIYQVPHSLGGSDSVDYKPTACPGTPFCVLLEYTGTHTSNAFDVASGSAPVATGVRPITSLAATTSLANELIVNFIWATGSSNPLTSFSGTARTQTPIGTNTFYSQDSTFSVAGSTTSTADASGGTWLWYSLQAAFK